MAKSNLSQRASNMRDFRIDHSNTSTSTELEIPSLPQQKVKSRASTQATMQEWTNPEEIDQLWNNWNQEFTKVDLGKSLSSSQELSIPKKSAIGSSTNGANAPTAVSPRRMAPPAPPTNDAPKGMARSQTVASNTALTTAPPTTSAVPAQGQLRSEQYSRDIPWSVELAEQERLLESNASVDFSSAYSKQELLKKRTKDFILSLQRAFRAQIEVFNEARRSPAQMIHIYKIAGSEADFMLFRNGVKLVVSGQRAGKVLFAFNQFLGQIFAPNQNPVVEIEAQWGPFDQLVWTYRGERLQNEDVVRFFMTEFSRQSYR